MTPRDDEPIDFSALAPDDPPGHWQGVVEQTLARVEAALAGQRPAEGPFEVIAAWRRPLARAGLAAGVVFALIELALERRETHMEQVARLVAVSTSWPANGPAPTGADFLRALAVTSGATP
jgi:hypothetical protein